MIPDSVGAFVAFVLLIAPGYYWQRLASRYNPGTQATAFREATRTVFSSLLPTGIAAALLFWAWIPVLRAEPTSAVLISMSFATYLLACLFVYIYSRVHFRTERAHPGRMAESSTLHQALATLPRTHGATKVEATIRLLDGTLWHGAVIAHDSEAEVTPKSLLLQPRVSRLDAQAQKPVEYGEADYVLVFLDQVSAIDLRYVKDAAAAVSSNSSEWLKSVHTFIDRCASLLPRRPQHQRQPVQPDAAARAVRRR